MYDYSSVVDAIEIYIANSNQNFKLEDVFLALVSTIKIEEGESKKLSADIEELLNSSNRLFKNEKTNAYMPRNIFFKGAKFCVTPGAYEIENKILYPGHRFAPFCFEDVFPTEVALSYEGKKLKTKVTSCKMEKVVYSHFLLGSELIMNFLIAENKSNYEVVKAGEFSKNVKISAFDMTAVYEKYSAKPGDALICTVEDWEAGKFSFEFLKAAKRKDDAKKKWVAFFDTALEIVFEDFGLYLEIPEQLAQATFCSDKYILANPDVSFEEFYDMSENVEIGTVEGRSVLVPPGEDLSEGTEIPENVMISAGNTESIADILKEIKCPLTMTEIEACMYNELYDGGEEFGTFYERCFGNIKLEFVDEGQKVVFDNFMEDSWERLSEGYSRFGDEDTGRARARILEVVEAKKTWIENLKDIDFDLSKVQPKKMEQLAKISVQMNSFLALLNSGEKFKEKQDFENVMDAIEQMAELQENLIEEINEEFINKK